MLTDSRLCHTQLAGNGMQALNWGNDHLSLHILHVCSWLDILIEFSLDWVHQRKCRCKKNKKIFKHIEALNLERFDSSCLRFRFQHITLKAFYWSLLSLNIFYWPIRTC